MRLYFCRAMLRHNLFISATLSASLALMGGYGKSLAELALGFALGVQICLVSVGLVFDLIIFRSFMKHTLPLYWNLGISGRQLALLAVATGVAGDVLLSLGLAIGGAYG